MTATMASAASSTDHDQPTVTPVGPRPGATLTLEDLAAIAWFTAFDTDAVDDELTEDDDDAPEWPDAEGTVPGQPAPPSSTSPSIAGLPPAAQHPTSPGAQPIEPGRSYTLPEWLLADEPAPQPAMPSPAVELPSWLFMPEPETPAEPLPDWLFLEEPQDATTAIPEPDATAPGAAGPAAPVERRSPEAPSAAAIPPDQSWRDEIRAAIAGESAPEPPAEPSLSLTVAAQHEPPMEFDFGGAWSMVRRLRERLAEQERIEAARTAALAAGQPLREEHDAIAERDEQAPTTPQARPADRPQPPAAPTAAATPPASKPPRRGLFGRWRKAKPDKQTTVTAKRPTPVDRGRERDDRQERATTSKPRRGLFARLFGRRR